MDEEELIIGKALYELIEIFKEIDREKKLTTNSYK